MLDFTLTWVLRFAAIPFFMGLVIMAMAGYTLFDYVPAVDPSAPFVPGILALGVVPWYLILGFGFLLVAHAWRIGLQARHGDF